MKLSQDATGAAPGSWKPTATGRSRERFKATVRCPAGHEMTLSGHTIADDGTVSPSVVCPTKGCTFHEFVTLDGWAP